MKCPLCGEEMNIYEEIKAGIHEKGLCCKNCEIGFFAYKNHDNIIEYVSNYLMPAYISKQEQIDWLESKLEQQANCY